MEETGVQYERHILTFFVGSRRRCDSAPLMHTFSHHCSRHLASHRTLAALFQLECLKQTSKAVSKATGAKKKVCGMSCHRDHMPRGGGPMARVAWPCLARF